jgi:ribosomal protein L35AE/L33A
MPDRSHGTSCCLAASPSVSGGDAVQPRALATATFVQRDNWRNGANWQGVYGIRGWSLFQLGGQADSMEANVSYSVANLLYIQNWVALGANGPRFLALYNGSLTNTGASTYYTPGTNGNGGLGVTINDTTTRRYTLYFVDNASPGTRQGTVTVYDMTGTATVIDAARNLGDFGTTGVYMTWIITAPAVGTKLQFNINCTAGTNVTLCAFFVDWPNLIGTKTHGTSSALAGNLRSRWKLDEVATGAVAADAVGGFNASDTAGTTTGTDTPPATSFANPFARNFPGGTCLTTVAQTSHQQVDNFTVSAWARPWVINAASGIVTRMVDVSGTGAGWSIFLSYPGSAGKPVFEAYNGSTYGAAMADVALPVNAWSHVVGLVKGGVRYLYVNGVRQSQTNSQPITPSSTATTIGLRANNLAANYWNGDIDDVRYYGVPLTDDQIQSLAGGNEPTSVAVTTRTHGTSAFVGRTLLSWWKLDENGTGLAAVDSSSSFNATDGGGTTTPSTPAPLSFTNPRGRHFPGNTALATAAATSHAVTDNFAVTAWMRTGTTGVSMGIIARMDETAGNGWALRMAAATNRVAWEGFNGTTYATITSDTVPATNTWHHVAGVQRFGVRYLYLDGILQSTTNSQPLVIAQNIATYIGQRSNTNPIQWNGDLDDVRFYGVSLTDDMVQCLAGGNDPAYTAIIPLAFTADASTSRSAPRTRAHTTGSTLVKDLASWWKFNESGTGQTALDAAPLAANAVDQGGGTAASTNVAPLTVVPNPYARSFPGGSAGNYLATPVEPLHGFTQNFTISVWFNPATASQTALLISHTSTAGTARGWILELNAGLLEFFVRTPTGYNYITSTVTPPAGAWTQVAVVGTATAITMYVGGVAQPSPISTAGVASPDLPTYLGAGAGAGTPGTATYNGLLDDARIYIVPLGLDAISSLSVGNDPALVTVTTTTHGTDVASRSVVARVHTTGSLLRATAIKTYAGDSLVRTTIARAHGTDSLSPASVAVAHTGDALARATVTRAHTSNSLLRATLARAHTVDALVRLVTAIGHGVDTYTYRAVVLKIHGTSAVTSLSVPRTAAHTGDSLVRTAVAKVHTSGSLLRATVVKTHTGGSLLRGTITRAHSTDSFSPATITTAHAGDSLVRTTVARAHTGSSWLRATITRAHAGDGLARATTTTAHAADSLARLVTAKSHTGGSLIRLVATRTHTGSSLVRLVTAEPFTSDSRLQATTAAAHTTGSLVQLTTTRAHTASSLIRLTTVKPCSADSLIRLTTARPFTGDSWLQGASADVHATSSWLRGTIVRTHSGDSWLRGTITRAHAADSLARLTTTRAHTSSSWLWGTITRAHTTSSWLRATTTAAHGGDALIRLVTAEAHTTGSWLRATTARIHYANSLIRLTATRAHGTDSLLPGGAVEVHTGDSLLRTTTVRVHTSTSLTYLSLTKAHTSGSLLRATTTKTYTADVLARATAARAHATDVFLPGSATVTAKTDALIALGIMASRSRSQRVGTRTVAFN